MTTIKYKFRLEKSPKKKGNCPNCGARGEFRFYESVETGERVDEQFGICERRNNCGYSLYPTSELSVFEVRQPLSIIPEKPITYVEDSLVDSTFKDYEQNNLIQFFEKTFGFDKTQLIIHKYRIGTAQNNGTIFWHCDTNGNAWRGKKIVYKPNSHRRNKEIDAYYIPKNDENTNYKVCLFGEHLLKVRPENNDWHRLTPLEEKEMVVAIVESEKSAIVASIFYPEYVWLACGGANGLSVAKCEVLRNKTVLLFNDFDLAGRQGFGIIPKFKHQDKELLSKANEYAYELYKKGSSKEEIMNEVSSTLKVQVSQENTALEVLRLFGCKVDFLDLQPEVNNSDDIADILLP